MRKSLKAANAALAPHGISIRFNREYGEYSVRIRSKGEGATYYTDDLADAVETAYAMAGHGEA